MLSAKEFVTQIDKKMFIPDSTDFINSKRDEAIVEILGGITELVRDGIKYRSKCNNPGTDLTAEVLRLAQCFITEKGLQDEFSDYCRRKEV